jgi:hypothetical protein
LFCNILALGIVFVSLSEQMDTTTPTGKTVFTVQGAVAELERSLIVERVRAGLRNARANGKTLGRPRNIVDAARIAALSAQGLSLRAIASELGGWACHASSHVCTPFQNSVNGFWNAMGRSHGPSGPPSDKPFLGTWA